MPLFKRASGRTTIDRATVITGRCWLDPALDVAVEAVRAADGLGTEQRIDAALAHLAAVRDDPERLARANQEFADGLAGSLDELRERARTLRAGPEAADARALLARALVVAAWDRRGPGWAADVPDDVWKPFRVLLEEADEAAYDALERSGDHAGAAASRMVSALGLGLPRDEWWHRFEVARRAKPTLWPAHASMLSALCAKWYGNDELMWDFARRTVAQAPAGDPVVAVLPIAHLEQLLSYSRAQTPDAARRWANDLRTGADDLAAAGARWAGAGTPPPHPMAYQSHQLFGYALTMAGDKPRARSHYTAGSRRLGGLPWDFVGGDDPVGKFVQELAEVGAVPAA
jgi:hypothetical protein